jgi:hypothetical protein
MLKCYWRGMLVEKKISSLFTTIYMLKVPEITVKTILTTEMYYSLFFIRDRPRPALVP